VTRSDLSDGERLATLDWAGSAERGWAGADRVDDGQLATSVDQPDEVITRLDVRRRTGVRGTRREKAQEGDHGDQGAHGRNVRRAVARVDGRPAGPVDSARTSRVDHHVCSDMSARIGAAIAAVLLVVTVAGCADSNRTQATAKSSAHAKWVDRRWQLTEIDRAGHVVMVPSSMKATLQLTRDGRFLADDTVNALSGAFRITATGFRVMSSMTTLVGYAGSDPTKLSVIAAIDEVASGSADVTAGTVGATLTVAVSTYRLTFRDTGPAVVYPSAPPTATSTVAHS
jgi:hypothetical protein